MSATRTTIPGMNPLPVEFVRGTTVIRRWTVADADDLSALIATSIDHLRPWMAWAADEPLEPAARVALIHRWNRLWESGAGALYGVFVDAEPVGGCSLRRRIGAGGLDVGYWLGSGHTGTGVMTRAISALVDGALELPDVSFVEISHALDNRSSARVAERLGFAPIDGPSDSRTWRRVRQGAER